MKIMFVGDISLGEYYLSFGHGPKSFSKKKNIFSEIKTLFESADFVVGNLEAAITNSQFDADNPESMVLRADTLTAPQILKDANFGLLQVSNNHTVQHSKEGFDETVSLLAEAGIKTTGLNQQKPVLIEHGGLRYGFVAASDVPDNTDINQTCYQRLDEEFLASIESECGKFDHFIVMLHWGLEASTTPVKYQRELVDRMYGLGVRAVIGSHPHLFYEVEKRKNFIVAYSLGNFVFDLSWDKRMLKTGVLEVDFSEAELTSKIWPVQLQGNGCLPTPSGKELIVEDKVTLYDLGSKMNWQQFRKVIYMLQNIFKGSTKLKLKFLIRKVFN
jgi:hypothetical protein